MQRRMMKFPNTLTDMLEVGHWEWTIFDWMVKHPLRIETHGVKYLMNQQTQGQDCS